MFISDLMKDDATYFSSDISDEMNRLYVENFEKSNAALNPKIKLEWIKDSSEQIDIEKYIDGMGSDISKKLFCIQADNEKLPYPDNSFDLYLSSLSLMLVNNYKNQISECYRVLQPGGKAGFTTFGRPENCNYATFIPEVLKDLGHDIEKLPANHLFDTGNIVQLEKDFRDIGFTSVKLYYIKNNILFENEIEQLEILLQSPVLKNLIDNLTEEEKQKFLEELNKQWNQRFGVDSIEPTEWELLVCVVAK